MKEKGILLVVGSLLAFGLAIVIPARAAGTLNFIGKIINESCRIANNGGDVNVDFGSVDMSALKSREAKTAETPSIINPIGCLLAQNIGISLKGTPDTNANGTSVVVLVLSDAADTAKGVGIGVFSSPDGSAEGTQSTFDKQSKMVVSQVGGNGDTVFNFIVDLKSDSSLGVTAGNINATVNIDIVYEQNVLVAALTEGSILCPYFHSSRPGPQLCSIIKWLSS